MNKKRKMYFRMITASLMRRRSRMLIALLAIAIGATILSGLVTIYYDVPRQMGAEFRNYGANMILVASEESFTLEDVDQSMSYIKQNELVGVTPYHYETVRIHELPVLAAAMDLEQVQKTSPYWNVDGDWAASDGELMIGKTIASDMQLGVGDSITVTWTPSAGDAEAETTAQNEDELILDNEMEMTITGIVETGGSEEDYVYMSLADMETLTGTVPDLDIAEVSVSASGADLENYKNAIIDNVDAVSARLVKRVTASETTVLSKLQALVLLVTIIVLALTMITVATTMTAVVTERRKEIGLRKALGASDQSIRIEFLGEGLLLGGLGGILGSILGFAFAQAVSINVFSSSISFRPLLVPITIIVSVVVTGAACMIPVRSATDVDPALVLKGE